MEKGPKRLPPEQQFSKLVQERTLSLWIPTIDLSTVSSETKQKLKEDLDHFQNDEFMARRTLSEACHDIIAIILRTSAGDKNKAEATALFENLRDDIWTFYNEINNHSR